MKAIYKTTSTQALFMMGIGFFSFSTELLAYRHGDLALRFGAALSSPNDKSTAIFTNGIGAFNSRGTMNTTTQGYVGLMFMFTDWLGFEMMLNTPFVHKIKAQNYTENNIGKASVLLPRVAFQWYPAPCDSVFQPYLGIGGHYAGVNKERLSQAWKSSIHDGTFEMSNNISWNGQLGTDITLNEHWLLNLSATYYDLASRVRIVDTGTGTQRSFKLHADPVVYNLGLSLKF